MDPDDDAALAGLSILIVEDDGVLSMMLADTLTDFGCRIVGNFADVEAARAFLAAGAESVDVAILDVNLGGVQSYPIAEMLDERGIPFLFATGDDGSVDSIWRERPRIAKPFNGPELRREIAAIASRRQ